MEVRVPVLASSGREIYVTRRQLPKRTGIYCTTSYFYRYEPGCKVILSIIKAGEKGRGLKAASFNIRQQSFHLWYNTCLKPVFIMDTVTVNHIVKAFTDKIAVNDLSFTIKPGEIFGIIGPNGAGKTTTIKMIMDIIRPDSGEVKILGEKFSENSKDKIGYMPEERGLYKKARVLDTIVYLATLKGMGKRAAIEKANMLLEQTGMLPNARKKMEELSKGMSQLIQFIVTTIHDPQLLILDEPFSGLDPVNTESSKKWLQNLRDKGKSVVLSTHQMNQVEEMCDRILMVNHGRAVLYGNLREIKTRFRNNSVIVACEGEIGVIPGVTERRPGKDYTELFLDGKTTPQQVLQTLLVRGVIINRFELAMPPLNEIFIKVAGEQHE